MSKKSGALAPPPIRLLTPIRIGLLSSALVLVAALAAAFFKGQTESVRPVAHTTPQPTLVPKAPAAAPASIPAPAPSAPTATMALSANMMETTFPLLNGSQRSLKSYAGKVVVLDLWATWCGPCRKEIPHLVELAKEFKGRGLEVLGLTTENPEKDAEKVRQFVREFKINYPVGWANEQFAQGLMKGRDLIPQTYVIGRDGQVRNYFVGFNPQTGPPQLRAAVAEAVAAE